MPIFDLKKISAIKGKQSFFQLTIDDRPDFGAEDSEEERNEKKTGVLDVYERGLEKRYRKDLKMIFAYMDRVANNLPVPGSKYHELDRPKNDHVKDFEFKHGDLRVYGFKDEKGKIFVLGGYKNAQKKDIEKLRTLKTQYLDSLKK